MKNIYFTNYRLLIVLPVLFSLAMLFLVFVSPGLKEGLDIRGGTMIVVQTDKAVDSKALETTLKQKFNLEELTITTTGVGVRIQFTQNPLLAAAEKQVHQAESLLSSNPVQAQTLARTAVQSLQPFAQPPAGFDSLDPVQTVQASRDVLVRANQSFKNQVQETILSTLGLKPQDAKFQTREVGSSLGKAFWENALNVTFMALFLITVMVFVFFREFVPSAAIVAAAIIDILTALGGMALFHIPLSLSTIPALLMVVGYSIDTDILLTTRLLKKKEGDPESRAFDSMITGITMSTTTLLAALVMLVMANYYQITIMFEIASVVFFGLIGDMISTWLMNAPVLLWYVKSRKRPSYG